MTPDLIIIGQVTVDHVVPARPGAWEVRVGGSALYAAAGARLWLDPARIGLVVRVGDGFPAEIGAVAGAAGIGFLSVRNVAASHITEWIIYEEDGSRRCLPRNEGLRRLGSEGDAGDTSAYLDYLLQFTPEADDVPRAWLPTAAIHLAPQVRDRHRRALGALRGQAAFISVDPSPFYARALDAAGLARELSGATAILPSELEASHLAGSAQDAGEALVAAGTPEVVLKRGAQPVLLATRDGSTTVPVPARATVDPTGAGDAFCGAYTACRLLGFTPLEATQRAIVAAGMTIGVAGVLPALAMSPAEAEARLRLASS